MKKIALSLAVVATMAMVACSGNAKANDSESVATDSVEVVEESTVVEESVVATDSAATTDTAAKADSVKA